MQAHNDGDEPYYLRNHSAISWMTPATLSSAAWFERNAPPGSRILFAADLYGYSFAFVLPEHHTMILPWHENDLRLRLVDGELCIVANALYEDVEHTCITEDFLYLVKIRGYAHAGGYHIVFERDLMQALDRDIDYVYLPVYRHYTRHTFQYMPPLFAPDFGSLALEPQSKIVMGDGVADDFEFYIFKVQREHLGRFGSIPLLIDEYAWSHLQSEARELVGDDYEYPLLKALGNPEIRLLGEGPSIADDYGHLGDVYLRNGQVEAAVRQYRVVLRLAPWYAKQFAERAARMQSEYPDLPATSVLLGDAWRLSGEFAEAQRSYRRVFAMPDVPDEWLAAAYEGLGEINLAMGAIEPAVVEFQQAVALVAALPTQKRLYQAQSIMARQNDAWGTALFLERTATMLAEFDRFRAVLAWAGKSEHLAYDLLMEPRTVSPDLDQRFVRNDFFDIGNVPRAVLFAHAPVTIAYTLRLPEDAHLRFSIALSPEIWQLGKGDGVEFLVNLDDEQAVRHILLHTYIDPKNLSADRRWHPYDLDLSSWGGQVVTLALVTQPGESQRFDWAGWGEPRIVQPATYSFLSQLSKVDTHGASQDQLRLDWMIINSQLRDVIFAHPFSQVTYPVYIPPDAALCFGMGLDPLVWSPAKGDGVRFEVVVQNEGMEQIVFSRYIDPKNNANDRRWFDECVSLEKFANQDIKLSFVTSPGPAGDDHYDWAGWSNPVLMNAPGQ